MSFGALTTRLAGTVQTATGGSGATVVTGLAGGDVTSVKLQGTPTTGPQKIAFVSNRDGDQEIYLMDTNGDNEVNLTNAPASNDYAPVWSPDGSRIAFTSNRTGNAEIFVMNSNGSGQPTNLTNNAAFDAFPAWSPDGTRIAFVSSRFAGNNEILVMNADGTGQPTNLTNSPATDDVDPAWSPDSNKILFRRNQNSKSSIYVMNANGSGQTNLSLNNGNVGNDDHPAWSPDGTRIAFISSRFGQYELCTMKSDGTQLARLTMNGADDRFPDWSPDGSVIVYGFTNDFTGAIYTINANGGTPVPLTSGSAIDQMPAWSGPITTGGTSTVLIGTGGVLGTGAAGFLVGMVNGDVTSFVAFDGTPRSFLRCSALSGLNPGLSTVVFSVTSDQGINRLAYINGLGATPVTVVSAAGTSGAIVSFNAATGRVATVLPYTSTRSAAPRATAEGGRAVIRGAFTGAWDGTGKNRALGPVSEVTLDGHTGEIVSMK